MTTPMILLYHVVRPVPLMADAEERNLFVSPELFREQMGHLHERGFRSMTLDEYRRSLGGTAVEDERFLLTFDDAYAHVDQTVTPMLEGFGFTAVMFASWDHLGDRNTWDGGHANLSRLAIATADQLMAMAGNRWEIASHSLRHVDLTTLSPKEVARELTESRDRLSELIGKPVVDLAYPFGACNESVCRAAAVAGYQTGFLAENTAGLATRYAIPRRPVRGDEGMAFFKIKTSSLARSASRLRQLTPEWMVGAARKASV